MKALFRTRSFVAALAAGLSLVSPTRADTAGTAGQGFTVAKNVSSDKPLAEKVVIFEKGKSASHLSFGGEGPKFTLADDGSLVLPITGFDLVKPIIRWKEGGGRPASFDPAAYNYLVVTMSFEGTVKTRQPNGKVTEARADNLWFSIGLFDAKDKWPTILGLAEFTEDNKTPSKTTALRIPLSLFANVKNPEVDARHITGIGFFWPKTRENTSRDFKLVIEKIVLAD